jgi:hypothetical protein
MIAATPMPSVCSFACVAADAVDDRLDVGAVVADEHQQQAVRAAQRGEGVPRTAVSSSSKSTACQPKSHTGVFSAMTQQPPNNEHRTGKLL